MQGFTHLLKTANGTYELNRVVGFFGGVVYVVMTHVYIGWEVFKLGKAFDLTGYCLTFPTGLAAVVGGTAVAVAVKDRNVATSKVIEATGSKPATPPAPAPTPQPELTEDDGALPPEQRIQ